MKPFLYKFFHEKTNDRTEGGIISIPNNKEEWPEKWKVISFKEYARAKKILFTNDVYEGSLLNLLKKRSSDVSKLCEQVITINNIGAICKAGYGIVSPTNLERRSVPSGGARFPLELYVCVWGEIQGLKKGNYHYNIKEHGLDVLSTKVIENEMLGEYTGYTWSAHIHGAILLSAVFDRSTDKYGSRGYRYILLEAGHVGQNICLAAAEEGLSVRPMGGVNEASFEELLQLDQLNERIIYALFI